jgi:hypothetical protein
MVCVIAISLSDLETISTGNGTQSIVWQINEEAYQAKLATEAEGPSKPGLQAYYGSVHDILSFPCEVTTAVWSFQSSD